MNQPQLYSKNNGQQRRDAKYVLDNYLHLICWKIAEQHETILDIGCGDGGVLFDILLPKLPQNFHKLYGIDISGKFLDYASKRNNDKRIVFEKFDISSNELPKNYCEQFNHIFSFYCLHWVIDQKKAFENIYKMLKPNGYILLIFPAKHPFFALYEILSKTVKWSKYLYDADQCVSPYQHSNNPKVEMERLLKQQGFNILTCQVVPRLFSFQNFTSVVQMFNAVSPFLKRLPEDEVDEYNSDIVAEARKLKEFTIETTFDGRNDGTIHKNYELFIIVASKP